VRTISVLKSAFLGGAAGLVAMTVAQAADLPVKAKPVQYVKICSLYGAGFYYMPGTDTCLKVGGYVRAEYDINAKGSFSPIINGAQALHNRSSAENNTRSRANISLDARTQTEYGTLRAYLRGGFQSDNSATPTTSTATYRFFVQLAGFTAGLTQSFFDFYSPGTYSNLTRFIGSYSGGAGITVFAYTAQFGNGLSATISAEDANARRTTLINVDNAGFNKATNAGFSDSYAANRAPDIVGNIRLDQAWGSAQVMGALHNVSGSYYGATEGTGHPDDELGFAVGGGVKFNLPFLGKGDNLTVQAAYADGATRYNGFGLVGAQIYDGNSIGLGFLSDAVYGDGTDLELTKSWSVTAGYDHHWSRNWKTSLYGAYFKADYGDAAATLINSTAGLNLPAGGNPDFAIWQVGSRTTWTPVQNLDVSVDVLYNKLESGYDGGTINLGAVSSKPAGVYSVADQDWWQGIFRVQRNFYP
jgi:hypothetical protein